MSDGCEQRERFPAALQDGYVRVDEMSFESLVSLAAAQAEQIRFVDPHRGDAGHWGELFTGDESLVMARILAVDCDALQAAFVQDADSAPQARLAHETIDLASLLDAWLKSLAANPQSEAKALADHLKQRVLGPLGGELDDVYRRFGALAWEGRALAGSREALDPAWFDSPRALRGDERRPARETLRACYFALLAAVRDVQAVARRLLPASLQSQAHEPAAALLLAFVQLFAVVQRRINRFTDRHVDFYYRDCLGLTPRPAVPDRVHLVCERDLRAGFEVQVPSGTLFAAGKDRDGRPIRFAADGPLNLSDARVAALCTLRLERDPQISPEREFGYVTRAKARPLPLADAGAAAAASSLPFHPLFGGSQAGAAVGVDDTATIGLAIASPLWFLAEGEREIRITLHVDTPGQADAGAAALARQLQADPRAAGALLPGLFARYLASDAPARAEAEAAALAGSALARLARRAGSDAARTASFDPYTLFLTERALQAQTQADFCAHLGRLFGHWLLAEDDALGDADLQALRDTARRLPGPRPDTEANSGDPLCLIHGTARPERDLIFERVFNGLFEVALTQPAGWVDAVDTYVGRSPLRSGGRGLQIVIRLRPEDEAVVGCDAALHGAGWNTTLPLVRVLLRSQARLYPYSLLEGLRLREAVLAVAVNGVRQVQLHNQLGRLDPSKPFHPFGPLPALGSYLVFGAPEIARKKLDALTLHVEWGGLPSDDGGFATHYAGYGADHDNPAFTASVAILRDGQWQAPASDAAGQPLFRDRDATRRVDTHADITVDPRALHRHQRATSDELGLGLGARNGFFRLQLNGPAGAFGHAAYPALLTEVVSANARRRRHASLPNAPYTPVIERLTLDYRAQATVQIGLAPSAETAAEGERVFHVHPFGLQQIHPSRGEESQALIPRFEHDGNLFIGLDATELQGALTLLFHLRDEAAVEPPPGATAPALHWACLGSNRWHALTPAQVLSDTTDGFLTSGIVTLDIPASIDRRNSVLPADRFWLRLSADRAFHTFAGLHAVRAQALSASRVIDAHAAGSTSSLGSGLAAGSVQQPVVSIPGLAAVTQVGTSFGMREAEDRQQFRTRVGERLRHKSRAVTPWDFERLVLENFPEVFKVRCIPNCSPDRRTESPGHVLVVVVPAAPRNEIAERTRGFRLNAIVLHRIRDFLCAHASPHARLVVRNAVYERVQVRCTLKLVRGAQAGVALRRVNDTIIDLLSPWVDGGDGPRFDWRVRSEDIEAQVRRLDCVDFVTKLSLLHIARSDHGVYTLSDTARETPFGTQVGPAAPWPWSLVLPTRTHILATTPAFTNAEPERTGIDRLAVGSTFIVGRSKHDPA